jgi:NADPH2:quinone reductase
VKDFTGGAGVATVFDGVGGATWEQSLECCARRGLVITFGNAGGLVTGVNLQVLTKHGSLFTTRPTMGDYYRTPDERRKGIARVFEMLKEGAIDAGVQQEFALEDVAEAHRKLEASETTGATVLIP